MPPVGYVVFGPDGQAGIHCGTDENGNELVAWIGAPAVVEHEVDEKGNGTAAYSTHYNAPESDEENESNSHRGWGR